jgi:hypothetical protein
MLRVLRAAARAHEAPLPRTIAHAAGLRRRGWRLGELAMLGLLDPGTDPDDAPWALRGAELEALQEALNPPEAIPLAEDKVRFAEVCREHGLPAPPLVAVLERGADREATAREWAGRLERIAPQELVVKPAAGHRGLSVRLLRRVPEGVRDHRGRTLGWEALARELAAERWPVVLVQERVHTHPALRRLTDEDVLHTLRVVTLVDEKGPPRIIMSVMRIAVGREPVDSFRSGSTANLVARVRDDGTLAAPAALAPSGFGLVTTDDHPASGERITGLAVPHWDEACALARRAAEVLAPLRTVGWDIAPTPDGPALIEANGWWAQLPDPNFPSGPGAGPHPALAALRGAVAARGAGKPGAPRGPRPASP